MPSCSKSSRGTPRAAVRLALLASLAVPAAAQQLTFAVGEQGATLQLPSPWQREKFDEDLGADQFTAKERRGFFGGGNEVYAVVREIRGIRESDRDLEETMSALWVLGTDVQVVVERTDGITRAVRAGEGAVDGTSIAFHCEIVARDGLAYHFAVWSLVSHRRKLQTRAKELTKSLSFPGPKTDFGKTAEPVVRSVSFGSRRLDYSIPLFAMRPQEAGYQQVAVYASADDEQRLTVQAVDVRTSMDALVAQEARELAREIDGYAESRRGETVVAGLPARWIEGGTATQTVKSMLIPFDKRCARLRWYSTGPVTTARPTREACFASLTVTEPKDGLVLPDATPAAATPTKSRFARFASGATRIAPELDGYGIRSAFVDGDRPIACTWDAAYSLEGGEWKLRLQHDSLRSFAVSGERQFATTNEGALHECKDGNLGEAVGTGSLCAFLGTDLVLGRQKDGGLLGLAPSWNSGELVRRSADGTETAICSLPIGYFQNLVCHAKRREIAIQVSVFESLDVQALGVSGEQLWLVPLEAPVPVLCGDWSQIAFVAAAADGWLVTGMPRDEAPGVWLVRSPSDRERIVAADPNGIQGLSLDASGLTFFAHGASQQRGLFRASREACRTDGNCLPFSTRTLAAIAARLQAELGDRVPNSAADVRSARARADGIARELCGQSLPSEAADLDALAGALLGDGPLSETARTALALLYSCAGLDAGGEWVPSADADWQSWRSSAREVSGSWVAAFFQPNRAANQHEDSEDGPYSLEWEIQSRAGRPLLVGLDAAALVARARQLVPDGFVAALADGDADAIAKVFAANESNVVLRRYAYRTLGANGRHALVERLSQPFAQKSDAATDDLVAHVAARGLREPSAEESEAWFDAALAAVQKAPREAALYYWLGRAAERAFPGDAEKSRPCYERVLELQPYGAVAEAARKALAR